jgi:hypothetical protein
MAYGISVTGNNNSYQIDSDTSYTEHFAVVSADILDADTSLTIASTDLIFAKPYSPTVGANRVVYKFNSVTDPTNITFKKKVYYVRLSKTAPLVAAGSTTGNYGIQVKNSSGTIIFDSRVASTGMKIIASKPRITCGGARQPEATGETPVLTGVGYPGTNSLSTVVYTGSLSNVYISCQYGQYDSSREIGGFYYDYVNSRILNHSWFNLPFSIYLKNISDILIGNYIT